MTSAFAAITGVVGVHVLLALAFVGPWRGRFPGRGRVFEFCAAWTTGVAVCAVAVVALAIAGVLARWTFLATLAGAAIASTMLARAPPRPIARERSRTRASTAFAFAFAMLAGAHARFAFAVGHEALPQIDPYGHLFVAKSLAAGDLATSEGYYADYPRGFHALVVATHAFTGLPIYDVLRWTGPLLGVLALAAGTALVYAVRGRTGALVASCAWAVGVGSGAVELLPVRETLPTPEILGHALFPIALWAGWEATAPSGPHPPSVALLALATVTSLLVHPLTAMFLLEFLLALAFARLATGEPDGRRRVAVLLAVIAAVAAPVVAADAVGVVPWDAAPLAVLAPKHALEPDVDGVLVLALAALAIVLGVAARRAGVAFAGSATVVAWIAVESGALVAPQVSPSRALPFLGIATAVLIGIVTAEGVDRLPTAAPGRPSSITTRAGRPAIAALGALVLLAHAPLSPEGIGPFDGEERIEASLRVAREYPARHTLAYSELGFLVDPTQAILEPEAEHRVLRELIETSPEAYSAERPFTFVFFDRHVNRFPYGRSDVARFEAWMDAFERYHGPVERIHDSVDLIVYLLPPAGATSLRPPSPRTPPRQRRARPRARQRLRARQATASSAPRPRTRDP